MGHSVRFQEPGQETAAGDSSRIQIQNSDSVSVAELRCDGIAHDNAIEAAGESIALALKVPAPLKSIADQVIRSTKCAP